MANYDPRRGWEENEARRRMLEFGGKIQRDQEAKRREAEQRRREEERRQHQLRGCGDANCAMCNPETAVMQASTFRGPGGGESAMDEAVRRAAEAMAIPSTFFAANINLEYEAAFAAPQTSTARPKAAPKADTAAYKEARKAVEKWITVPPEQGFDDIIGADEALELLRDAIEAPVKHKEVYEAYGMKPPKGCLLSGPPGVGKTMFARAAASAMRALYGKSTEMLSLNTADLQSMYVGETEARIKTLFTYAREYSQKHGHPLLIFIDEAEVLLPDRTGRVRRVAPWEESQVATFLAEMDGLSGDSGAFVMLASNRPEVIDQAVLRDGRCDFKIVIKRPNAQAVETIIRRNFDGQLMLDSVDDLVMAACESLFDPHKVIAEAKALGIDMDKLQIEERHHKHFLLEHIVSGAMAASIPGRAKRYAFSRDKTAGKALGITVSDVIRSVTDIFEENRKLEHSFAMKEFKREFEAEVEAMPKENR